MTRIHHYYHIYADGAWKEAVQEHTAALQESALADQPGFVFYIGIAGSQKNFNEITAFLDQRKLKWRLAVWECEGWEQLTLNALTAEAHRQDGLVCYAHTKGAHAPGRFNTDWRRRMTYFNFIRWRDAVTSLETHHAYGCHWMELEGNWIFGGNFWWTRMEHVRLLPPPANENRWRAEEWIGQLRNHVPNFKVQDPAPPFPGKIDVPTRT